MAKREGQRNVHDMFLSQVPKCPQPITSSDDASSDFKSESEGRVSNSSAILSSTEAGSTATETNSAISTATGSSSCALPCCTELKPCQPINPMVLASLANKGWRFVQNWYQQFPWLTLYLSKKKVFCFYCRHNYFSAWAFKNCSLAFISDGFNNWKKAVKFNNHESSHTHLEARMK